MLISMIILWAVVVIEFVLIIGLVGREVTIRKTIDEIVDFFGKYTVKAGESRKKMVDTIDHLADKVIELYEWKENQR